MRSETALPRVAFVDHSFHRTSRATDFLHDLLAERAIVERHWDGSWIGEPPVRLDELVREGGYRVVVLFQLIDRSPRELRLPPGTSLVAVPMADNLPRPFSLLWRRLARAGVRFLSFSETVHRRLRRMGADSLHARFYPDPEGLPSPGEDWSVRRGFFWQRRNRPTWKTVRRLIRGASFDGFVIHRATDPPGFPLVLPGPAEVRDLGVRYTDWFPSRADYLREVARCTVYFAPREVEGIGMSFLEAMAMGRCVVAPDRPVMNEVIRHGENGLLYRPRFPRPLDFSDARGIGGRARAGALLGHREWLARREAVADFILGGGAGAGGGARA
jgi:glycosyltransferase involved in cell wall biosynthesis